MYNGKHDLFAKHKDMIKELTDFRRKLYESDFYDDSVKVLKSRYKKDFNSIFDLIEKHDSSIVSTTLYFFYQFTLERDPKFENQDNVKKLLEIIDRKGYLINNAYYHIRFHGLYPLLKMALAADDDQVYLALNKKINKDPELLFSKYSNTNTNLSDCFETFTRNLDNISDGDIDETFYTDQSKLKRDIYLLNNQMEYKETKAETKSDLSNEISKLSKRDKIYKKDMNLLFETVFFLELDILNYIHIFKYYTLATDEKLQKKKNIELYLNLFDKAFIENKVEKLNVLIELVMRADNIILLKELEGYTPKLIQNKKLIKDNAFNIQKMLKLIYN